MPGQKGHGVGQDKNGHRVCQRKKGMVCTRAKGTWCMPGQKGHSVC